ncbi:unnamed protein product [Parascedosporium putredinis]|uniref:Uncharacterized protein n=1 Tax=Parascedosporium putredinis TaxID=1442378 RepID=A0A9P1HA69_9PEZI|nr:unnamed protein product [Parascedosporium putredinis]CAI8002368.1 unnamed protein product [Parascedosporium putredinis]
MRSISPAQSFQLGDDQTYMSEQREIPRKAIGSPRSRSSSNASISSVRSAISVASRRPSTPAAQICTPVREEEESGFRSPTLANPRKEASPKKRATPVNSPVRSGSVSKNKGRKNSRQSNSKKQLSARKPSRGNSRWTFTENVTELFSGQLFKKVEADEMLTPEQVEAYTRRREAKAEMAERREMDALEAIRSILEEEEDTDGPGGPFHLEELARRIEDVTAAGVAATQRRRSPPITSDFTNDVIRRDFSVRRKPVRSGSGRGLKVSSPLSHRKQAPFPVSQLKTPPASSAAMSKPKPSPGSTPCTMTMPGFRHGPIRISKSGLEVKFDAENTLDWTAFQMAILGGAGDFFYGSADFTPQYSEEEEVADLKEWLGEMGFSSIGALISSQPVERPEDSDESSSSSPISTTSSCYDEGDEAGDDEEDSANLPIPVALDYPTGFWNEGKPDTSKFSIGGGCQIKRWTAEGHPKRYNRASCASEISLPQSPMMPLVISSRLAANLHSSSGGAAANDLEVVPMGYNLGHDLGDFLKWEAEHCYAADFEARG